MMDCWNYEPSARPSFNALASKLEGIIERSAVKCVKIRLKPHPHYVKSHKPHIILCCQGDGVNLA